MNKRVFWTGLGSGVVIGALLLQMMLGARGGIPQESLPSPTPASDKAAAGKTYSETEFKQALEARLKEELAKQPTPAPVPTDPPEKPRQTVVYVMPGLTTDKVVEMLNRSGIVSDPVGFLEELKKRSLTNRIRSGVHIFEGVPDLESILNNLTKPD